MSISSVAIMVGSLRRLARIAARANSNVSCDRIEAYRKLLRIGSSAASVAASFLHCMHMNIAVCVMSIYGEHCAWQNLCHVALVMLQQTWYVAACDMTESFDWSYLCPEEHATSQACNSACIWFQACIQIVHIGVHLELV